MFLCPKNINIFRVFVRYNCSQATKPFSIFTITMAETADSLSVLFTRLKNATRQANTLIKEVEDIKKQIYKIAADNEVQGIDTIDDLGSDFEDATVPTPAKKTKFDFNREGDYVVVYTDGACENNGKNNAKAGYGVWFEDNHPLNVSEPVKGRATNNNAEIQACSAAVKVAKNNGVSKLKILTDSQFTINCMTKWIHGWKKKNWKLASGGPVKNKLELEELDKLCKSIEVKFDYVPGHKGHKGNECADALARKGAEQYKAQ